MVGYNGINQLYHGSCMCTLDNALVDACSLQLHASAQTMVYLRHQISTAELLQTVFLLLLYLDFAEVILLSAYSDALRVKYCGTMTHICQAPVATWNISLTCL